MAVGVCECVHVGGWVGEEKEIILRKHIVRKGARNAQWFLHLRSPNQTQSRTCTRTSYSAEASYICNHDQSFQTLLKSQKH